MQNRYKVPKRKWNKWSKDAQRVFNEVYREMFRGQHLFLHPGTDPVRPLYWKTTCWNAAWIAADKADRIAMRYA